MNDQRMMYAVIAPPNFTFLFTMQLYKFMIQFSCENKSFLYTM